MRLPLAGWVWVLCAGAPAQDHTPEIAYERFRWIGLGDYLAEKEGQPLPAPADIDLCRWAMGQDDDELVAKAVEAFGALSRRDWFAELPAEVRGPGIDQVIGFLGDDRDDVRQKASRAVRNLASSERLSGVQARQAATQALGHLLRPDAASRAQGATLAGALLELAGRTVHDEIARTGLLSLERYPCGLEPRQDESNDALERRQFADFAIRFLLTRLRVRDPGVAADLARRFAADLDAGGPFGGPWLGDYSAGACLEGLGRAMAGLGGAQREDCLERLLSGVAQPDHRYMTTSGVRTPFFHRGCDGLAEAIPALTAQERARAERAVAAARAGWMAKERAEDRDNMLRDVEAALAKASAGKDGPRPAARNAERRQRASRA